jgi:hypothetical protein
LTGQLQRRLAPHILSAWLTEEGLVVGQVKTDAKCNEITAIPELLQLLDPRVWGPWPTARIFRAHTRSQWPHRPGSEPSVWMTLLPLRSARTAEGAAQTKAVPRTGSGAWLTHTARIVGALFDGSFADGMDFRIVDGGEDLEVRFVRIIKPEP